MKKVAVIITVIIILIIACSSKIKLNSNVIEDRKSEVSSILDYE